MKIRLILIFVCVVGVTILFTIYTFSDNEFNENKTRHINLKEEAYHSDNKSIDQWPFHTSKNYKETDILQWSEPAQSTKSSHYDVGELGVAFIPSDDIKELMDKLLEEHNYNLLASDMISLHRTLPDARSIECKSLSYPAKLPTTSVIIIFHNEGWSTLLRTVWSVIDRSPPELIKEIVLVDDFSTWPFLKRPLDDYIELLPVDVMLIRTSKREGLIRARLLGAQYATGNVLAFLDAHMECNKGWLQPLLAHIARDRSVVAVPTIDTISSTDMSYQYNNAININGFHWSLIFNWMSVPERELNRTHYSKTAAIRTPTIIGCGFAIDREFFFEIGSYDEGMNIWGSENLEMSLRVWQCGGSMEIVPCSRVGHLYRISTYSFEGDATKIKAKNNVRLVEVWMSDLKDLYYATNPKNRNVAAGDISKRKELRDRLKCRSFRWYLENIYPESIMLKQYLYFAQIKSSSQQKCLDIHTGRVDAPLITYTCHGIGGNQIFGFTKDQSIVTLQELCIGINENLRTVISAVCVNSEHQWWQYNHENKWLVHATSGHCLQTNDTEVVLGKCDLSDNSFTWDIISSS